MGAAAVARWGGALKERREPGRSTRAVSDSSQWQHRPRLGRGEEVPQDPAPLASSGCHPASRPGCRARCVPPPCCARAANRRRRGLRGHPHGGLRGWSTFRLDLVDEALGIRNVELAAGNPHGPFRIVVTGAGHPLGCAGGASRGGVSGGLRQPKSVSTAGSGRRRQPLVQSLHSKKSLMGLCRRREAES